MIIGITGKMGSGKSMVADYLVQKHAFVKCNFKDALLFEVKKCFPDMLKAIGQTIAKHDIFQKPYHPIMRALLQNFGTNVRRAQDHNYWVDRYAENIKYHGLQNVVTDDVRFLNEALRIKMFNGRILRINRLGTESSKHISETEMDKIIPDDELWNDGTPEQLFTKVESILIK